MEYFALTESELSLAVSRPGFHIVMAFCFGFVLGVILEKEKSLKTCIICHFIVDIGIIGLPLLVILP
ncbi:MAG: CPBP family intramembrane metalloprotease [Bacteroidetes bacterium]|nr:CPBP family intramembrane metalloprotease [Bacteroidota bacterium]